MSEKRLMADLERQVSGLNVSSYRPSMELVLDVMKEAMARVPGGGAVPGHTGPDLWTWTCRRGKVYAIAPSPDHDGHPMLTIRHPVTMTLGLWITTTILLLGNNFAEVMRAATVALVSHSGAYAGYQSVVSAIAENGDAIDGMNRACEISGQDPSVNRAMAVAIKNSDDDKGPGSLN